MGIIDFKATKCKHCYKCVRNCEVKAIMVKDGRAEIMEDKCILCGTCLQICPQSAKTLNSDLNVVKEYRRKELATGNGKYGTALKKHIIPAFQEVINAVLAGMSSHEKAGMRKLLGEALNE